MSRIQPSKNPDAKSQELLTAVKKKLGKTPNIFTTMAHSSATLGFYLSASESIASSKLNAALREQIALTVAGLNSCDYCASAHTFIGKMHKIAENELAQNLKGESQDAKVQAALDFVTKIVQERGHVSDADLKAVRNAGYDDSEIVDIIAVTSINIFTNYFNHIAGTEVDFPLVKASS